MKNYKHLIDLAVGGLMMLMIVSFNVRPLSREGLTLLVCGATIYMLGTLRSRT